MRQFLVLVSALLRLYCGFNKTKLSQSQCLCKWSVSSDVSQRPNIVTTFRFLSQSEKTTHLKSLCWYFDQTLRGVGVLGHLTRVSANWPTNYSQDWIFLFSQGYSNPVSCCLTSAVGVGDLWSLLSPREICRLVLLLLPPVWMVNSPAASTSLALELPVVPMGAEMRLLVST